MNIFSYKQFWILASVTTKSINTRRHCSKSFNYRQIYTVRIKEAFGKFWGKKTNRVHFICIYSLFIFLVLFDLLGYPMNASSGKKFKQKSISNRST
jgi:hypothetical protein